MIDAEGTFRDLPGLATDFTGDFVIPTLVNYVHEGANLKPC
jgi:hypothetical protein